MGKWNAFDSLINEEVNVQIVFPLLNTQRFINATRHCTIQEVLNEIRILDEFLNFCLDAEKPWVFDAKGNLIDKDTTLHAFGELSLIQLFIT